jgi:hypothetical protein
MWRFRLPELAEAGEKRQSENDDFVSFPMGFNQSNLLRKMDKSSLSFVIA